MIPAPVRALVRPPIRGWLGLSVTGEVPDGPVLLAAAHLSHADALAIGAATSRELMFLGSSHLPRLLRRFGMLPVDRGRRDTGALDRCLEVLGDGGALVVFPEGGRSRDGHVYRPRSGVARLAAAAGCPVVPVGIRGTAEVWPVGGRPRPVLGDVHVAFGRALPAPADTPGERRAFNDALHARLVALSQRPSADSLL